MRPHNKGAARLWASAALLALAAAAQAKPPAKLPPPLPEEEIRVEKLSAPDGYRLYVNDPAFAHMVDSRLYVIDGKSFRFLGLIGTGFGALTTPSADGKQIYVVTTYQRHLSRPPREDVLEIHDAQTLELKDEIAIPTKRAQAISYRGLVAPSADGRFLYIQNATPATSVTVVDLAAKKVVNEVQTPGCWSVYPWSAGSKVSTLCGDGTLLTLELDDAGQVKARNRSAKFFDPDGDPLFTHSDVRGDYRYFVSFSGDMYTVKLAGDAPSFEPVWSLVSAAERKANWRPGGYQMTAVHRDSGTLFVGMHAKGYEGSHKNPATEIWAFDLTTQKRTARIPGNQAVAVLTSQGADARLYALDIEKTNIEVRALKPGYPALGRIPQVGETPMTFEVR